MQSETVVGEKGVNIETCKFCEKVFTKRGLDTHFWFVHAIIRWKCNKCDKQFIKQRALEQHNFAKHNEVNNKVNVKEENTDDDKFGIKMEIKQEPEPGEYFESLKEKTAIKVETTASGSGLFHGIKRPFEGSFDDGTKKIKSEKSEGGLVGSGEGLQFSEVDGYTQVWTDCACSTNGKGQGETRAGFGVYWGEGHRLNLAQRVVAVKQTHNVAGIQAAIMAIRQAMSVGMAMLQVNTDSQFVINSVTMWMKKWKRNGWKTATDREVTNKMDFAELDMLIQEGTVKIRWNYVKRHSNNKGNIQAVKLAEKGPTLAGLCLP